jgi:hypothetical protein
VAADMAAVGTAQKHLGTGNLQWDS